MFAVVLGPRCCKIASISGSGRETNLERSCHDYLYPSRPPKPRTSTFYSLYDLGLGDLGKSWSTAPLSNSCIINIIWFCLALSRTPNTDCHWEGAVPNLNPKTLNPKPYITHYGSFHFLFHHPYITPFLNPKPTQVRAHKSAVFTEPKRTCEVAGLVDSRV